ncbi:LamG-like jellyroll fold domain-containing protein [Taibaiella soli]|uniref:Fibronectin type-III domain-containing protein n=1 Tax=Taibaiella soli TaxID=1649169 RepID=A0A2W2BE36_9BACT|nr:LamG-like jellyroll fold domain-containing protein [Taibaiella soli]PZF71856.1 hypothetical protein DN068_17530 [Taibaiella soli]
MKPKHKFRLLAGLFLAMVASGESFAQGPLRGMYFPGTGVLTPTPTATTNSFVDLGTSLRDTLANSNFTIELWVKMGATNSVNPVIIGDKDWGSGANTGFVLSYYASTDASSGTAAANTIRFNFKPASGTRVDYDIVFPAAIAQQWNHIAVTVNRTGSIIGYLNGVATGHAYVAGGELIAADSAKSIASTLPVRLGTDGKTFGYRAPFNGTMDEVRIWNTVRTPQQLRDAMCHKLTGSESNLMAYYQMNELSGTTVTNSATATSGLYDGTIVNSTYRVPSGAPVGDTSVNLYSAAWAGQSLSLPTTNRGIFTVDSFGTTGSYLHLYQINATPDSTQGVTAYGNNNVYFGTFASGDTFSYYPKYNYSNYPDAVTYHNTINFFTRRFNDISSWTSKTNLYNNTAGNTLRTDSVKGTRQFFLANFINSCGGATALGATNIQATGASLSWTTGGSALWNIEYGVNGFTQGTGTRINAVNTNPYSLTGLLGNTAYQFYVQDSCAGIGTGTWAGPYSFTTLPNYGNNASGYAVHFDGTGVQNSTVQAVNLGNVLRDSLATTDFTIEMWVKVGATNTGNPPLIADKDYVSGANTGICWTYTASVLWGDAAKHVFRFNFKPTGGARHDYDMIAANEFTWNHVAITVDRHGFIKGYINGVYHPSLYATGATSVLADTGKTLAGTMPLYLGTDGTGNYRVPFNGDMDEVRVWNHVRTETEIREAMCHKLNGGEQGLLAYYRMNEPAGPTTLNAATATGPVMNGTAVNNPAHIVSGAPVGDTSVSVYPAAGWNGVSLNLNSNNRGVVTVDSVMGATVPGVHIYMVNGTPNYQTGVANMGTTDKYFGVFTADSTTAPYRVAYDYNNYSNASANAASLHLYNRPDNAATIWAQLPSVNNTTSKNITRIDAPGTRQYLLADFVAASCPAPSAITLVNATANTATFTWTSSAAAHKTKAGFSGFDFATATPDTATTNTKILTGLTAASTYDFYVQDSCGAGSTSAWVGPYTFQTVNPCPQPVNIFADSITSSSLVLKWTDNGMATTGYVIAWGIAGTFTDPTIAINQNATTSRYEFTSLQPLTSYSFYVKTNCNATPSTSGWVGPLTFTTDSVTTIDTTTTPTGIASHNIGRLVVYPNPASDKVLVNLNNDPSGKAVISVYNSLGVQVATQQVTGRHIEINTAMLPDGVYHIAYISSAGRLHSSIVIQHNR